MTAPIEMSVRIASLKRSVFWLFVVEVTRGRHCRGGITNGIRSPIQFSESMGPWLESSNLSDIVPVSKQ